MCGIYFAISRQGHIPLSPEIQLSLRRRGPDSVQERRWTVGNDGAKIYLSGLSTVLSLRGDRVVSQPLQEDGCTLCWNGEAWKAKGVTIEGNDAESIFAMLLEAAKSSTAEDAVLRTLSSISGPYAFVFYDERNRRVYYGRDCLGRRSLLAKHSQAGDLILASVSDETAPDWWNEVNANDICVVDLDPLIPINPSTGLSVEAAFTIRHLPFVHADNDSMNSSCLLLPFPRLNDKTPDREPAPLTIYSPSVAALEQALRTSLALRMQGIPGVTTFEGRATLTKDTKLAILFSGGLDCTVLARIVHDLYPEGEPIDLLNVAFENPRVHHSKSFGEEVGRWALYETCPDRATGRASQAELQRVCPGRTWRFVEINIPFEETTRHRSKVVRLMHPHNTEMDLSIAYALYFAARGSGVVRDLDSVATPYVTPARVLLSGLGADELFGGYQRHATAFSRQGYSGLARELALDIGRLGERNLGRDDRVISDWAKEVRFPYLDEDILSWALKLPVWEKCSFGQDSQACNDGDGDLGNVGTLEPGKKVLRLVAWRLGMTRVAKEKKRAIQFGARTARMGVGRVKGTQTLT